MGVAAQNEKSRQNARKLIGNTTIEFLHNVPLFEDATQEQIWSDVNVKQYESIKTKTVSKIKEMILDGTEMEVKNLMYGLNSDAIACVVKICSNSELVLIGQKVFNPLPNSKIGSKGYMGARIQPNSPTNDPEDIVF